ncbi:MAG TPA: class I fructose-bisphosphate aldolase [Chloroflexota bacterium]|nr:class I fructose-bisphosphate aldolase [Chloroflexota bacterium]
MPTINTQLLESEMFQCVRALLVRPKGILAADESLPTIAKRFESVGMPNSQESRRRYREMLIATGGLEEFISGVILFDETARQASADGTSFIHLLEKVGIVPGIKVDAGLLPIRSSDTEDVTSGFDGLPERLDEYFQMGLRFAKWRSVFRIGPRLPSDFAIDANAIGLAQYASACQGAGLVPIVESEVLLDGDHSLADSMRVSIHVLTEVVRRLEQANVRLDLTIVKTGMAARGSSNNVENHESVGAATARVLSEALPPVVGGVVFLSGGMSELEATRNFNEFSQIASCPWPVSFSFGRALQTSALKRWATDPSRFEEARAELLHRARMNSLARMGDWSPTMETTGEGDTRDF